MHENGADAALAGVRIVDFSRVLAGPYATMMLADLGAEVIKVERPVTGDETRSWGPPWSPGPDGAATYFLGVNRNKSSVTLDLTTDDGREQAAAMVAQADVVVENFRPGTMDRLGLGYAALSANHPGLIYCSISGFGAAGGAHLAGYDLVVQAASGLMSITGDEQSGPMKSGVALIDIITGLHASVGIQAALRHRDRTGAGQRVDVDLLTSALAALSSQSSAHLVAGVDPEPMGNAHPSIAPYEVVATRDRPLALAAPNNKLFIRLCEAMGRPDLSADERYAENTSRVTHRAALMASLGETFAEHDADHWFSVLTHAGVPCAPVNSVGQAFDLARTLGLDPVTHAEDSPEGPPQVRNPIRLSGTPARHRTDPPARTD
ncbi:CoA transferase [Nocardioides salsibiostraticola]